MFGGAQAKLREGVSAFVVECGWRRSVQDSKPDYDHSTGPDRRRSVLIWPQPETRIDAEPA